jgi:6-phosphofructokinase 2
MTDIITLTINPAVDLSTTVAKVQPIRKLRCAPARHDPGGGGINVARVVDRLGGNVTAVYPVSGPTGQLLRRLVDREGIRSLTIELAGDTREDFTVVEEESGQQYRFVLPGPQLSAAEARACLDALAALKGQPKIVVASGSLPPGVPTDFYVDLARVTRQLGARFVLDTSGPPLAAALAAGVFLIKPNLRELCGLMQISPDDPAAWLPACRKLVNEGRAEIVALTLGDRGALLVTRDRAWRAPALPVEAVSAVGAGDSFLGAIVWSLVAGHPIEDAFRYGVAGGTAALLAPGTELCRRQDVERLVRQVVLHAA